MLRSHSRLWCLVFAAAFAFHATMLMRGISKPWVEEMDFNGACWSQSAHNTLAAGLWATKGVPSAFYFGPMPIPASQYYTHHPAVLSLMLTGMFAVFGEHEWVARLLPILFSLASTVLLFYLVKSCVGARAAAFATAVFVTLPMELHYGNMVNFEPLELTWMLAGLISLRRWEQTRERKWWIAVLVTFAMIFWTAWLGYMFLLVLCLHYLITARKKNPRLAFFFIGLSFVSFLVFLAHISWVQPAAVTDLVGAFWRRISGAPSASAIISAAHKTTWTQWLPRISSTLVEHINPLAWVMGVAGAEVVLRRGRSNEPLWWLGSTAMLFFVLNAFYVIAFRNASYIHDYACFYFIVPVALMAGVAFDAFLESCERHASIVQIRGAVMALLVCLLLGYTGVRGASALRGQFRVFDETVQEPPNLIPELGKLIKSSFPPATIVACNFLSSYGPHLPYYAQRLILGPLLTPGQWESTLKNETDPVGGIIWMGEADAKELVEKLPPGTRESRELLGFQFVIWKPANAAKQ